MELPYSLFREYNRGKLPEGEPCIILPFSIGFSGLTLMHPEENREVTPDELGKLREFRMNIPNETNVPEASRILLINISRQQTNFTMDAGCLCLDNRNWKHEKIFDPIPIAHNVDSYSLNGYTEGMYSSSSRIIFTDKLREGQTRLWLFGMGSDTPEQISINELESNSLVIEHEGIEFYYKVPNPVPNHRIFLLEENFGSRNMYSIREYILQGYKWNTRELVNIFQVK